MNPPTTSRHCIGCGREIPRDAPDGDCPACLMRAGFDTGRDGDDLLDPLDVASIAARFPKLEILGRVGRGGMGVVYRARQRSLDRIVALKILHPDLAKREGFAERFEREARSLALLDHPHVVRMYEAGNEAGLYYLLMEFVEGSDLRGVMNQGVPPQTALRLVQEISDALEYAHGKGVVHRDIKPENILIDRAFRAKIADFGLAKLLTDDDLGPTLTQSRVVMGTPQYMAPEQMRGMADVDHRADIFSLGVVLYEMLTGALPVGHFPPPSKKVAIDVRVDEVVLRALENERELRFQRAGEVGSSVRSIESDSPRANQQARARDPSKRTMRRAIASILLPVLWAPLQLVGWVVVDAFASEGSAWRKYYWSQLLSPLEGVVFLVAVILGVLALRDNRAHPVLGVRVLSGCGIAFAGIALLGRVIYLVGNWDQLVASWSTLLLGHA